MTLEELREIAERERVLITITTQAPNIGIQVNGVDCYQGDVVAVGGEIAAELIMSGRATVAPSGSRPVRRQR